VLILGLDVETTGLSAVDDKIIEVGAALYDTVLAAPVQILSVLVNPERKIPQEITEITGIADDEVEVFGIPENKAIDQLQDMMTYAEAVMAHNAPFDRGFIEQAIIRSGRPPIELPWIDSVMDVKYPANITTRNLRHLAAEHGFINPWAHRSIFDVMTMLRIASCYDWDAIVARSKELTVYLQAVVSFDEKEKAKERGYRWYAPSKIWWKSFKFSDAEVEVAECGFRTNRLQNAPE
jgi:DNA polymerase-3 subunit epsilon